MKFSKAKFAGVAAIALAAAGTAGLAQARDNVYFSLGANVAPGVAIGVSNGPAYPYYAPRPYYYAPQPVYVAPQPVYYQEPVTYYETVPGFAPVFVNGGWWWGGHRYYRGGGHWVRYEHRGYAGGYGHGGHHR